MTTPRDPTNPRNADQLIHAFLDEGPTDLREQVFDEVRTEIDRTEQRTTFGPWRNLVASRVVGVLAVGAVVVLAVLVGLSLSGGGPLVGGNLCVLASMCGTAWASRTIVTGASRPATATLPSSTGSDWRSQSQPPTSPSASSSTRPIRPPPSQRSARSI